jgi:triosephosphate isomerase
MVNIVQTSSGRLFPQFRYAATFDGYEPGDMIGTGATPEEAEADLMNQHNEQVES